MQFWIIVLAALHHFLLGSSASLAPRGASASLEMAVRLRHRILDPLRVVGNYPGLEISGVAKRLVHAFACGYAEVVLWLANTVDLHLCKVTFRLVGAKIVVESAQELDTAIRNFRHGVGRYVHSTALRIVAMADGKFQISLLAPPTGEHAGDAQLHVVSLLRPAEEFLMTFPWTTGAFWVDSSESYSVVASLFQSRPSWELVSSTLLEEQVRQEIHIGAFCQGDRAADLSRFVVSFVFLLHCNRLSSVYFIGMHKTPAGYVFIKLRLVKGMLDAAFSSMKAMILTQMHGNASVSKVAQRACNASVIGNGHKWLIFGLECTPVVPGSTELETFVSSLKKQTLDLCRLPVAFEIVVKKSLAAHHYVSTFSFPVHAGAAELFAHALEQIVFSSACALTNTIVLLSLARRAKSSCCYFKVQSMQGLDAARKSMFELFAGPQPFHLALDWKAECRAQAFKGQSFAELLGNSEPAEHKGKMDILLREMMQSASLKRALVLPRPIAKRSVLCSAQPALPKNILDTDWHFSTLHDSATGLKLWQRYFHQTAASPDISELEGLAMNPKQNLDVLMGECLHGRNRVIFIHREEFEYATMHTHKTWTVHMTEKPSEKAYPVFKRFFAVMLANAVPAVKQVLAIGIDRKERNIFVVSHVHVSNFDWGKQLVKLFTQFKLKSVPINKWQ